jgi:hypothetical protein
MSLLSQVTLHIRHVPAHCGKVTVLCNIHADSIVGMHTEMYTDNTGAMAYLKDCTKLLQQPTVSPCDTFTTVCTPTLRCCFGVKQLETSHYTCDQICKVEGKLCQFADPTHTIAEGHLVTSVHITRAAISYGTIVLLSVLGCHPGISFKHTNRTHSYCLFNFQCLLLEYQFLEVVLCMSCLSFSYAFKL